MARNFERNVTKFAQDLEGWQGSLRKLPALMGFLGSEADQIPSMPTPFSDFEKNRPRKGI